jgi:hypothetical protein
MVEFIGIIAAVLILVSMIFPTMSFRGSVCMRIINTSGSMVFIIYGILLPAIATLVANVGIFIVNIVHLYILIKNQKSKTNADNN